MAAAATKFPDRLYIVWYYRKIPPMVWPRWYFISVHDDIGRTIVALRTQKGFSQEYLALECEMSLSYLRRIEHGTANPTIDMLLRIAEVLDADIINPISVKETAGAAT